MKCYSRLVFLLAVVQAAFAFTTSRPPITTGSKLSISIFKQDTDKTAAKDNDIEHESLQSSQITFDDTTEDDSSSKFGFWQRIESIKCLVLGSVSGSVALTPFLAAHYLLFASTTDVPLNALAQFEFDIDMAAIQCGLFAIVYRYAVRTDNNNKQLGDGVTGAFCLTRTLSRIHVPTYCTALSINCGAPFGYVDWNILTQIGLNYIEAAVMFGATASALEWAMEKRLIGRFPE